MQVRVRLFSLLRERAGTAHAQCDLVPGATVSDALARLSQQYPALLPLLEGREGLAILAAVNREYAQRDRRLHEGDEVALFPPVSGGSGASAAASTLAAAPVPGPERGFLLLSGGFDSPVAGHLVRAGGRELRAVHFTMEPFTDDASAHKALDLARRVGLASLTIVPLGEDLAEFTRLCGHQYYFVLLKRLMVRVAESLAAADGATFLVTGENLGQVSSQTLSNLGVIDAVSRMPILRPLLGFDKQEIIGIAKSIGTYETSCGPELCDLLGPKHPATATTRERIAAEEAKVDVAGLVRNALQKAYVLSTANAVGPITPPGRGLAC